MTGVGHEGRKRELRQRLEEDPDNGTVWLEYADLLQAASEEPHEAVRALAMAQRLLHREDLRARLGQAYIDAAQPENAVTLLRAVSEESGDPSAYVSLADACLRLGLRDEAVAACHAALAIRPDSSRAYFLLGDAYHRKSRAKAVASYREAVRLDPQFEWAWQALGRELAASVETLEEGMACLERALELDPNDVWARLFYANGLWKANREREAAAQYEAATQTEDAPPEVHKWYADFLDAHDSADEAEKQHRAALLRFPGSPSPLIWYACFLEGKGRLEEAEALLKAGVERHPLSVDVRRAVVGFLERQGRDAEAQQERAGLSRILRPR